jgi:hypothetical protein
MLKNNLKRLFEPVKLIKLYLIFYSSHFKCYFDTKF